MEATDELRYLALRATKKLDAKGHEKWLLRCYRKNKGATERALGMALETPANKIKNCPGALFTFWFKKFNTQSQT